MIRKFNMVLKIFINIYTKYNIIDATFIKVIEKCWRNR